MPHSSSDTFQSYRLLRTSRGFLACNHNFAIYYGQTVLIVKTEGRWSHPEIVTHLHQTEIKCVLVCCSLFDILLLGSKDCSLSAQFLNKSKCFAALSLRSISCPWSVEQLLISEWNLYTKQHVLMEKKKMILDFDLIGKKSPFFKLN